MSILSYTPRNYDASPNKLMLVFIFLFVCLGILLFTYPAVASGIEETEPNDSAETAQTLAAIGAASPVTATINPAGNPDWYRFDAVIGRTYVVEVFDVVTGLASEAVFTCSGLFSSRGLRITVYYDPVAPPVVDQCGLGGGGHVHTFARFQADRTAPFYIRVLAHSKKLTGGYQLRILPKYDESDAIWDTTTFEPNNHDVVAYQTQLGYDNEVTSTIEQISGIFSRVGGDVDFYRFDAEANKEYIVQLLNVADTLTTNRVFSCSGNFTSKGLRVTIYNPAFAEVTDQCFLNRDGTYHQPVRFTTNRSGTFYVRILPHDRDAFGDYTIGVIDAKDERKVFLPVVRN